MDASRVVKSLTVLFFLLAATQHASSAMVVEYYNPDLDHYFITADPAEQSSVDSGAVGRWQRTGSAFQAGGANQVCRFYGSPLGPNSHFYTADAQECSYLKSIYDPAAKSWKFESNDFSINRTVNGACAAGQVPIYRAYNNGFARQVDSNHRITPSQADIQYVVARGWSSEGIVMCAAGSSGEPISGSAPALFFTDLTSGPGTGGQDDLGAFITLYGEGFGATRGTSTVTLGGAEVARYVSWGQDNGIARNLDMIVVQPGPDATSGNLVVTVNGKASNPLPFTVRGGQVYFVVPGAPNADDNNPGTHDQPWRTISRPRTSMHSGDIVFIQGGTFSTADPAHPGWDCVLCLFSEDAASGTAEAPIAYIGYPGDPPILGAPLPMRRALLIDQEIAHYVIANLRFTNYGGTVELAGNGHRIVGNYSYDGVHSNSGSIGIMGNSAHYSIFGNRIRNNGEPGEKMNGPGFYLQGFGLNNDIDFGWNQIEDQRGSRAIQVYGHIDNDRVDNVSIHDNFLSGSELNNIVLGGSDGVTDVLGTIHVYNNIIIGAGDPGLRINDPQGTVIIQNNVFYNNGTPGFGGSNAQVYIERAGPGKITFQDNIVYAGSNQSYFLIEAAVGSAALNASHNLVYNAGVCPAWDVGCINADPLFVNIASADFRIQAQSPAINAGINTGIAQDYAGTSRPQNGAYDIGAYEYVAGQ